MTLYQKRKTVHDDVTNCTKVLSSQVAGKLVQNFVCGCLCVSTFCYDECHLYKYTTALQKCENVEGFTGVLALAVY